jgi:hypothetical protein
MLGIILVVLLGAGGLAGPGYRRVAGVNPSARSELSVGELRPLAAVPVLRGSR